MFAVVLNELLGNPIELPETKIPCAEATWLADPITSLCILSVVVNVFDILCDTDITLYIPVIGDNVFPDITIRDTGCAISYLRVVPGMTI